ncbi:MAG: carboxymuconolactone decarboxylase family protein, partial [Planctomycetota bacterium]
HACVRAAPAGEPDDEWREAILQSHLFLGFPRIVEAFEQLAADGGLQPGGPLHGERDSETTRGEGDALFDCIYGDLSDKVRRRLRQHHGHFADWIAEHAYGRVLSRPGLDGARRELLALVCLALGHLDRQFASHCRGALRLGATRAQVLAVLTSQREYLDADTFDRLESLARHYTAPDQV